MYLNLYILKIPVFMVVIAILPDVKATNEDKTVGTDAFFKTLLNRLEHLEDRDEMREIENKELKHRVQVLESLATEQQIQISNLEETLGKQNIVNRQLQDRVISLENRNKARDKLQTDLKSQKKRIQSLESFVRILKTERQHHEDTRGLPDAAERPDSEVQRIQRRENEMNVAFFAYLTNHLVNPGVHQIIAFDHVVTNIGNAYNAHAGDFRAPVAGTYVFATTLMAGDVHLIYHFIVMHNGKSVSNIYLVNGGTASQEVVLQLNQGDDVSIHNMDAGNKLYGSGYSTFSGFLLQQNYSSPVVVGK
ncbi:uncharacterized protein LOC123541035 [Mercenaria mercenaria]|uniref:uncharacterized protein LOC123541035 n=1 Tax=Mercenaria mercenaria TaxID=6596 RepID=UPI00234F8C2D|nr:uncharacterized protein LOC123541035 [Mercenaria mercenaria]